MPSMCKVYPQKHSSIYETDELTSLWTVLLGLLVMRRVGWGVLGDGVDRSPSVLLYIYAQMAIWEQES